MSKPTILVTGATGFLGSNLVVELVREHGYKVIALARSKGQTSAKDRVISLLSRLDPEFPFSEHVDVRESVVTASNLGLDDATIKELAGTCSRICHCAGDTRFDPLHTEEIVRTNVQGTKNALLLADQLGVHEFMHVSTAYVYGSHIGKAFEVPHPQVGQVARNPYEQSKWDAEIEVMRWAENSRGSWMIVRPPIVAGHSHTGVASAFTGYYGYMRAFSLIRRKVESDLRQRPEELRKEGITFDGDRLYLPIEVPGNASAPLSISTIDFVTEAMCALLRKEETWNKVYHLTPERAQSFSWWLAHSLDVMGIEGVRIRRPEVEVVKGKDGYIAQLEAALNAGSSAYVPYVSGEPVFDRTNADKVLAGVYEAPATRRLVECLLKYALQCNFKDGEIVRPVPA